MADEEKQESPATEKQLQTYSDEVRHLDHTLEGMVNRKTFAVGVMDKIVGVALTAIIAWSTFITIQVMEKTTKDEVKEILNDSSKYSDSVLLDLKAAMRENTSAVTALKIEIVELRAATNKD